MHKPLIVISFLFLTLIACTKKEQNPFEISKHHIGLLTDSTQVKDLETVFSKDSITTYIAGDEFSGSENTIDIYETGGKKLLELTPSQSLDSTATIKAIHVIDERYKTTENVSTLSTFKDITTNYKVSRIDNLINAIVVTVNAINASFTIDKKELPANLRFDMDLNIEASQIPDDAKIKYFFIHWN